MPLGGGTWAEVKTVVLGQVQPTTHPDGTPRIQTTQLSSFSRLTDAAQFTRLATSETHARGVERAACVVAVSDGAEWIQTFVDLHRTDAVRIRDFPHAAQRLTQIAAAAYGDGTPDAHAWAVMQRAALLARGPDPVLDAIAALQAAHPNATTIAEDAAYLAKRRALLDYPQFVAQGWPIGSGCGESANRLVVEARLKGAGMHGSRAHVNPMLALRNAACNDRWQATCTAIHALQRRARRPIRRTRRPGCTASAPPEVAPAPPRMPVPGGQAHPPPAHHPGKRKPALAGGMRHVLRQRADARD